eukprot:Plantae.Rhodophyta-Purpureofilum_apyrenoidigerum.ctg7796.p1 GENE.Plantae.Rhodophyta-Purpureofilum_apyrenoidigerum.ctg7796~~Plantae.Rhodophyta-Purpureofilum_apyrenoidigerum.ctg7796.p1  ORF type:complete len:326 (+),score=94.17 Plantae.Rhodophyta-Purpureofilum_apyrenoidigerum.ctg7796:301-1278(+)
MTDKLSTANNKVKALTQQLERKEEELKLAQMNLSDAEAKREAQATKIRQLEAGMASEALEHGSVRARIKAMQEETDMALDLVREKSALAESAEKNLHAEREKTTELSRKLVQIESDLSKLRNRAEKAVNQRDAAIKDLRKTVEELQSAVHSNDSSQSSSQVPSGSTCNHTGRIQELETDLKESQEAMDGLSQVNKTLLARCKALEKQSEASKQRLSMGLDSRFAVSNFELSNNVGDCTFQEAENGASNEVSKLRAKVVSLQNELKRQNALSSEKTVENLRSNLEQLRDKVKELQNDNLKLVTDAMEMRRKLKEYEAERGVYVLGY